jgi:hypothetical protein
MFANWQSVAVLLIGVATFFWLSPRNDSRSSETAQQVSAMAPGCGTQSGRCLVDIRFTYPAAISQCCRTTFTSDHSVPPSDKSRAVAAADWQ